MNKPTQFTVTTACMLLAALPGAASAASLLEIYQQALQSDPLIHEAEARRMATLEAVPQARGQLFPQINAGGSYTVDGSEGTQGFQLPDGFVTAPTARNVENFAWNAELRQTIFRWDQFVGLEQAQKRVAKAEIDFELAQQDLIVRVVTRYFDVLGAEDRLTSINADKRAIARQLEQARQRFEVGLIAITDVQESQAAYDQAVASEIQAKRELATSRELLREITGEYIRELSAPKEDFPLVSPNPASQENWIDIAMDQNLALVSSRFDEEIARDEISFRRTGHYPTVDLVANYRQSDTEISDINIAGNSQPDLQIDDTTDSIGVQFSIPLFAGGQVSSRVREAVYLHRASREQLQRVTRETERQTRDAYLGVESEISRVNALAQAVQSSRTALEATQAGFEVGTRTIVDVLITQRSLYTAITNYEQARYTYIGNVLRLKLAAGTLRIQDLELIDSNLVNRRPPEDVIAELEADEANP